MSKDVTGLIGGAEDKMGSSEIKFLINNKKLQIRQKPKTEYYIKWDYDEYPKSLNDKYTGIGYSLYSTMIQERENPCIAGGFEFTLMIIITYEEILDQVLASLWLAIFSGGFGVKVMLTAGNISLNLKNDYQKFGVLDFIILDENSKKLSLLLQCKRYTNSDYDIAVATDNELY